MCLTVCSCIKCKSRFVCTLAFTIHSLVEPIVLLAFTVTLRNLQFLIKPGSLFDPPELPGLSHFCQRMVMAGSTQLQDDLTFEEFIQSHGGDYSSAIQGDIVTFAFSIPSSMMYPALKRYQ